MTRRDVYTSSVLGRNALRASLDESRSRYGCGVKRFARLLALLAAPLAGCGGDDEPAPGAGGSAEQLFTDNCANCHTLAAAGATGEVGPDLDQLRPGTDLVNAQMTNGGGGMPAFKGKLSDEQIQQISDYVAENAGAS